MIGATAVCACSGGAPARGSMAGEPIRRGLAREAGFARFRLDRAVARRRAAETLLDGSVAQGFGLRCERDVPPWGVEREMEDLHGFARSGDRACACRCVRLAT